MEVTNKTFKVCLYTAVVHNQGHTYSWVHLIPQIAWIINTTYPDSLPPGVTPYKVWFGRKPPLVNPYTPPNVPPQALEEGEHSQEAEQEADEEADKEADKEGDNQEGDDEVEEPTLNQRVTAYIKKSNTSIVKKKGGKSIQYELQEVVTLKIPPKLMVGPEVRRLPVRILEVQEKGYRLVSQYGELTCLHSSGVLNKLASQAIYPDLPTTGAPKPNIQITLNKAVQLINNRGPVNTLQKAGRRSEQAKRKRDSTNTTQVPAKRSKVSSGNGSTTIAPTRTRTWANTSTSNRVTTRARSTKI
jgi:hypothetical protein